MGTKVKSNKNVAFHAGASTAFAKIDSQTLAELEGLGNYSEALKWDGFDIAIQASEQDEDRALTDAAGAASRGYEQYGGAVSAFHPVPGDTSSVYRRLLNLIGALHTEIVATIRPGIPASTPWAAGQVYTAFGLIVDAPRHQRGDKNRFYTRNLKAKSGVGVNRIVPSLVPSKVTTTPPSPSVAVGKSAQLRSVYEGRNITVGAVYRVADESVAVVTKHGKIIGLKAGSTTVTATYPGSAAGTPVTITVTT